MSNENEVFKTSNNSRLINNDETVNTKLETDMKSDNKVPPKLKVGSQSFIPKSKKTDPSLTGKIIDNNATMQPDNISTNDIRNDSNCGSKPANPTHIAHQGEINFDPESTIIFLIRNKRIT